MAQAKDISLVFVSLIADANGMKAMRSTRKPILKFRNSVKKAATNEIQITIDEKFINQYLRLIQSLPKRCRIDSGCKRICHCLYLYHPCIVSILQYQQFQ